FRSELLERVAPERAAQLPVVGHDPERRLEALLRVLRRGRRRRDLRNAGIAVDARRGNRRAGVQVADHADHAGVDELLRGSRALFRIRRVVLGQQLEADLLAADRDLLGVEFLDGELAGEFVVLAEVRDAAGERRDVADLDDGLAATGALAAAKAEAIARPKSLCFIR